jgi:cytochrome c oxidase subunit II
MVTRTVLLISALAASSVAAPHGESSGAQPPPRRTIEMSAERFEFWPSEIVVDEGEEVEFRVRSHDTVHGFRILGTGINLAVPKRGKGEAVALFTGKNPGRYVIECSRMCGAGHHFMRATLIVRAPESVGR